MTERKVMRGVALVCAVLFTAACGTSGAAGDQPRAVVWGEEACAECHMHVADPHYAAQLRTADGESLVFDDPGCLLAYLHAHSGEGQKAWFHHHAREQWIPQAEVRFVAVSETPMGYGLGAVGARWAGAMSFAEGDAQVTRAIAERSGGQP